MDQNIINYILLQSDVEILVDELATHIPFSYPEKQKILEEMDLKERCELMLVMLEEELDVLKLKQKIQQKVKVNVDKNQKEYMLREQMKVIREELGETNVEDEADEFMNQLKELRASDEVKEKIKKEILRFKNISGSSSESAVSRGYIETMLELPWNKASKDNKDLKNAERILNEDHYGLEKVKERMLEFLAVRNLTKKGESPIKGGGRLVVIDGGFCRAYHEKTGIAGYTLVYSSRTMSLRTHQPFESAEKAVKDNLDIISQKNILETENHRILVEDTDEGEVLRERVHDLKQLVAAYQLGWITETRCEDHIW